MKKGTYHMLNSNGFNVWAESYDKSVRVSDESDTYPFAGYTAILQEICHRVQSCAGKTVLDIGFGTATLTSKLYDQGYQIYGQDFSGEMIKQAQKKMPQARLNCPRLCGQHKKNPCAGIFGFSRSGAALAAPLLFCFGCARGCKSGYNGQSSHWLQKRVAGLWR